MSQAIHFTDGQVCAHSHSPRMVRLASKWLLEYFSDGKARMTGELEDDFAGQFNINADNFRCTPFYPALALAVAGGTIHWGKDAEENIWYALAGSLPENVTRGQA